MKLLLVVFLGIVLVASAVVDNRAADLQKIAGDSTKQWKISSVCPAMGFTEASPNVDKGVKYKIYNQNKFWYCKTTDDCTADYTIMLVNDGMYMLNSQALGPGDGTYRFENDDEYYANATMPFDLQQGAGTQNYTFYNTITRYYPSGAGGVGSLSLFFAALVGVILLCVL